MARLLNGKKGFFLLAALMLAAILATRIPGLLHGMGLHADEWVFYLSSESLISGEGYESAKLYPSGAFVFQAPFQFFGRLITRAFGAGSPAVYGRVAGLFYFCAGTLLGLYVVRRLAGKNPWAGVFYAAIMAFSLLHIEQSRYGTGDPISFFLLMLVLCLLCLYEKNGRLPLLLGASFAVGALGAIKLPLLIFLALPLGARLLLQPRSRRARDIFLLCLLALAGLLLFTPDFFSDPLFFFRSAGSELGAYMMPGGRRFLLPAKHLASTLVYQLAYSDFPLALLPALYAAWRLGGKKNGEARSSFWGRVVPLVTGIFLAVNLLASNLFFRSLYPYFFLCNLYAAAGLAALVTQPKTRKWARVAVAALLAVMAVRGGAFAHLLTASPADAQVADMIAQSGKACESAGSVRLGEVYNADASILPGQTYTYPLEALRDDPGALQIGEGELCVTSPYENYYVIHGPVPRLSVGDSAGMFGNWQAFKAENASSYLGRTSAYTQQVVYGAWLNGSTLPLFEFPMNYVYYKDYADSPLAPDRVEQYSALYDRRDTAAYLAGLEEMGGQTLLLAGSREELAQLAKMLPPLEEALPASEEGTLFVALRDGEVVYAGVPPGEGELDEVLGFPCEVAEDGGALSSFRVAGREYLGQQGFEAGPRLVVWDDALGRAMDWRGLTVRINDKH